MLTLRHLKSVINHAWHTSWLTLVAITLFGAVCLGLVRAFTPLLATQRTNVEHLASIALQQPIHIDSLKIRWHKFLPVLKLTNVVILDKENKHPLLQAEELDLSLDLIHSLLSGQFQIGPATLRGTHLKLEQHEDGTISLQGMGNLPASNDYNPDELMAWLFSIPQISLENVALSWY